MAELPFDDKRVIDADAPQYNATLVRRVDHTDDLAYSADVSASLPPGFDRWPGILAPLTSLS